MKCQNRERILRMVGKCLKRAHEAERQHRLEEAKRYAAVSRRLLERLRRHARPWWAAPMPVSQSPLTLSTALLIRGTGSRWAVTFRAHLGVTRGSVFLSGPIGLILLAEARLQPRSGLRCLVGHRTLRSLEQWEPRNARI